MLRWCRLILSANMELMELVFVENVTDVSQSAVVDYNLLTPVTAKNNFHGLVILPCNGRMMFHPTIATILPFECNVSIFIKWKQHHFLFHHFFDFLPLT